MRSLVLSVMVLSVLTACKRAPTVSTEDAASASASASASAGPSVPTKPADPVPGQYGRFFADGHRFSAVFPTTPQVKAFGQMMTAVEARSEVGAFNVMCGIAVGPVVGPLADAGVAMEREKMQVVGSGKLLAESHPDFYMGSAYEVRAQIDKTERIMRFVTFAGRYCSVGVELDDASHEQDGVRFVESFRPEPPPTR